MPYADREKQLEYQRRWNRQYYQENRGTERRRIVKRKKEIGDWLKTLKATMKCVRCDEHDDACLDFHHRYASEKDFNLGAVRSWGWGKERIETELKKCIVLCANCHRKQHAR